MTDRKISNLKRVITLLLCGLVALIVIATYAALNRSTHVGVIYPPYPSGCTRIGGGFFWDVEKQSFSTSIAFEDVQCEDGQYLWMKEVVSRSDKEVTKWKVVESLLLPIKDSTRKLVAGGCSYEKSEGDLVFSVLEASGQSNSNSYVQTGISYIGNLKAKKLEAIDESKVSCDDVNEE